MSKLKKALSMVVVYLFLLNILAINVFAAGTRDKTTIEQYLNYNSFPNSQVIQYKDSTFIAPSQYNYGENGTSSFTVVKKDKTENSISNLGSIDINQIEKGKVYYYSFDNTNFYNYLYDIDTNVVTNLNYDNVARANTYLGFINGKLKTSYKLNLQNKSNILENGSYRTYLGLNYNYSSDYNYGGYNYNNDYNYGNSDYVSFQLTDIYDKNGELWSAFNYYTANGKIGFGIVKNNKLIYFSANSYNSFANLGSWTKPVFSFDGSNNLNFVETDSKALSRLVTLKKNGKYSKFTLGVNSSNILLIDNNDVYTYDDGSQGIVKYSLKGKKFTRVKKYSTISAFSITKDKSNGIWALNKVSGHTYVSKLESKGFVNKYEVNNSMTALSVYDDKHIAVSNNNGYTIIGTRSSNSNLSGITIKSGDTEFDLKPSFKSSTTKYSLSVSSDVDTIEVSGALEDQSSKLTGDGTKELSTGKNTISLVVTAEDGSKKTYTITVTKAKKGSKKK